MSFLRYYAKYNHVQRGLTQFIYFRKITRLKKSLYIFAPGIQNEANNCSLLSLV